jgi:hypothetical protein
MATINLKRTGSMVTHARATGEISRLTVEDVLFWAVERRDGYISLDEGTYTVKMETSPTHKGRRQFRVLDHNKVNKNGETAPILIHAGNYPGDVQGCIAPGFILLKDGVDQSRLAMEKIFSLFGGFQRGRTGELVVAQDS